MEQSISWKDILSRLSELTGSDLESDSGLRGPIKSMILDEDKRTLTITCEWIAKYYPGGARTKGWHLMIPPGKVPSIIVDLKSSRIANLGESMIRFEAQNHDYFVLFPKHTNLDPKKVLGFPK